ncbi:hypothetical protein CC1G_05761 [Coprinopsis cinerea okayama7|uniref:RING-type domain-containing protein n=1 Tax=Coprinopsis cinerea (strain Okayama-7 / 130 / ATCC MYA-4618 / FGSC 9003) TaxID=240176 RepID=A8NA34_COPC7|nr:hypothetical protein CC1G_05761 [Coprinopsis cinerea okayama7\|eukprot:XP_001831690.2 hypothetical protein CC1G_05761 [Coprinopsis cinerea okayama7\
MSTTSQCDGVARVHGKETHKHPHSQRSYIERCAKPVAARQDIVPLSGGGSVSETSTRVQRSAHDDRDKSSSLLPIVVVPHVDGRSPIKRASLPAAYPPQAQATSGSSLARHATPRDVPRPESMTSLSSNRTTKKEHVRMSLPVDSRQSHHRYTQSARSLPPIDAGKPVSEMIYSSFARQPPPVVNVVNDGGLSYGWEGMQREVELLRKAVQDMHKTTRKQTKRIEELKGQLSASAQALKDKEVEVTTLKERCAKSERVVSTVEASVQCQICMELPLRPFALSPCGHVLCLGCLQEWFKTSPGAVDDDDDDHTDSILHREKTCPCCRTPVRHRPSPIFMVKAVVSALLKERDSGEGPSSEDPDPSEDDPWKGIFPNSDPESDEDDEDEEVGAFSDDEFDQDVHSWMFSLQERTAARWAWSSESDEEEEEEGSGRYADYDTSSEEQLPHPSTFVAPRWEPAWIPIDPTDYDFTGMDYDARESVLALLRRGCSWEMIQNFNMRYSHSRGIVVPLHSIDDLYAATTNLDEGVDGETVYHVHLGWNITLDEEDVDGERYMHSVLFDIQNRPERWRITRRHGGSVEVRKLVPATELDEYYTTDSDDYPDDSDGEVDDMDID